MNIKSTLVAAALVAGVFQGQVAWAANASPAVGEAAAVAQGSVEGQKIKKKREGNPRMKTCSAEFKATGKKSAERKQFMSECLKKPKA